MLLTLAATWLSLLAPAVSTAQVNPQIDKILGEREENAKGQLCVKFRQGGLTADDVMKVLQREKMDPIVAVIAGEYLEKGGFEAGKTALVVKGLAARRDMLGKAAAMAAFSPHRQDIVDDFMKSRAQPDRMLAAYILATWAWSEAMYGDDDYVSPGEVEGTEAEKKIAELETQIADEEAKAKENPDADKDLTPEQKQEKAEAAAKREAQLKRLKRIVAQVVPRDKLLKRGRELDEFNVEPYLKDLIDERSDDIREMTILAAAWTRSGAIAEQVKAMRLSPRDANLEAVRQLYLARLGMATDTEAIAKLIQTTARVRPDVRFTKLTPYLHSYDIRGTPLLYTLQAVATNGQIADVTTLHELLDHADLRVQQEAAHAIEAAGNPASLPALFAKLNQGYEEDDDKRRARKVEPINWPLKVAVLSAIGAIPAKESVEPLIAARGRERGRFRQDVNYALASIFREQGGTTPDEWRDYWEKNKDKVAVDPHLTAVWRKTYRVQDMKAPALTVFYGADILSDRVVFVLDTSASMKGDKIASLKANMEETLGTVVEHMKFNIVDFGGIIRVMNPGALIGAQFNYKVADLVNALDLSGGTRTYDAMEVGMLLPEADTVMYLSDGAPIAGQFENWDALRRGITLFNRYRPLSIYALYYSGGKAKGKGKNRGLAGNALQMMLLADQNAGLMYEPD
ncbi:MAG: hypothetical protein GC159_02595 [Phycisphaera sp.]|nr:hypothetical protein [Phycisphaera sp.]